MAAKKITSRAVQFHHAPATDSAVDDARADEIGPCAAEPAGYADDADGLPHVFPVAVGDAHPY